MGVEHGGKMHVKLGKEHLYLTNYMRVRYV
jgi:hypothetical protein